MLVRISGGVKSPHGIERRGGTVLVGQDTSLDERGERLVSAQRDTRAVGPGVPARKEVTLALEGGGLGQDVLAAIGNGHRSSLAPAAVGVVIDRISISGENRREGDVVEERVTGLLVRVLRETHNDLGRQLVTVANGVGHVAQRSARLPGHEVVALVGVGGDAGKGLVGAALDEAIARTHGLRHRGGLVAASGLHLAAVLDGVDDVHKDLLPLCVKLHDIVTSEDAKTGDMLASPIGRAATIGLGVPTIEAIAKTREARIGYRGAMRNRDLGSVGASIFGAITKVIDSPVALDRRIDDPAPLDSGILAISIWHAVGRVAHDRSRHALVVHENRESIDLVEIEDIVISAIHAIDRFHVRDDVPICIIYRGKDEAQLGSVGTREIILTNLQKIKSRIRTIGNGRELPKDGLFHFRIVKTGYLIFIFAQPEVVVFVPPDEVLSALQWARHIV